MYPARPSVRRIAVPLVSDRAQSQTTSWSRALSRLSFAQTTDVRWQRLDRIHGAARADSETELTSDDTNVGTSVNRRRPCWKPVDNRLR